jgi:hypothetical protein
MAKKLVRVDWAMKRWLRNKANFDTFNPSPKAINAKFNAFTTSKQKTPSMKNTLLLLLSLLLVSCKEGYRKQNGQWAWVTYGESFKKRVVWIYPVVAFHRTPSRVQMARHAWD